MLSRPASTALKRIDSSVAQKPTYFTEVDDELRDVKRVQSQGQEEDLRYALGRTIGRVEELTSLLKDAFKTQTELQTELVIAKSNLQLALANNEMLEDALKREASSSARDIGWRRWGAKEQREREEEERRRSVDSLGSGSVDLTRAQKSPNPAAVHSPSATSTPPLPRSASAMASPTNSSGSGDSRFFRFRFGAGAGSTPAVLPSPRASMDKGPNHATSHLTSASLPSLVPSLEQDEEISSLKEQLKKEKDAVKKAAEAKAALEAELESLSQALFEEANKMVATERKKLSELADELRETQDEKEALRRALQLVEHQSASAASSATASHSRARSSSSAMAIKSLPGSARGSPILEESSLPDSEETHQETHEETEEQEEESLTASETIVPTSTRVSLDLIDPESPAFVSIASAVLDPRLSAPDALGISQPVLLDSGASLGVASKPSRSPSPAFPGQFVDISPEYLGAEASPWADVASNSPRPAA